MTNHFVMTSSFRINNFKIDKFGDFSSDIDYHSRTDIFRDAISLIMNQCDPRRQKGASGGHFMSAGGALWAPVVTFINYNWDDISKYVCPTVVIDIAWFKEVMDMRHFALKMCPFWATAGGISKALGGEI